jgi:hypothetical protein
MPRSEGRKGELDRRTRSRPGTAKTPASRLAPPKAVYATRQSHPLGELGCERDGSQGIRSIGLLPWAVRHGITSGSPLPVSHEQRRALADTVSARQPSTARVFSAYTLTCPYSPRSSAARGPESKTARDRPLGVARGRGEVGCPPRGARVFSWSLRNHVVEVFFLTSSYTSSQRKSGWVEC